MASSCDLIVNDDACRWYKGQVCGFLPNSPTLDTWTLLDPYHSVVVTTRAHAPTTATIYQKHVSFPACISGPINNSAPHLVDNPAQPVLAHLKQRDYSATTTVATPGNLPSPPLSCASDTLLDFDASIDLAFDSASSPQSSVLVSPKTTPGVSPSFTFEPTAADFAATGTDDKLSLEHPPSSTVEALSQHHLERYLHYKALAAQAQAELSFSLINGQLIVNDESPLKNSMLALHNTSAQHMFNPQQNNHDMWNQSIQYQQVQQNAAAQQQVLQHAQVQAQVHLQQAQAVVAAQRNMSMNNYFMPPKHQVQQPPSMWSRPSAPESVSTASPPYPSTPNYGNGAGMSVNGASNMSVVTSTYSEGEKELEDDELSPNDANSPGQLANIHGGGRGYVPGKTPDDPKKRHKCKVCGRGFARAFNLKSHISTHDPLRPKPHQCPHPMCKRSFSRLHDLERHRQGIHSDGPLVDAKRHGVSPGVIRAQSRMRSRAESGGLI